MAPLPPGDDLPHQAPRGGLLGRYRAWSLGARILIWMVIGAAFGALLGERATCVEPLGTVFIRLLITAAIPLVFFNLFDSIARLDDLKLFGRLGLGTLAYYSVTTIVALTLGLLLANLVRPGEGMRFDTPSVAADASQGAHMPNLLDVVVDLFPENIIAAFAAGKIGQLVVFAVLLGAAAHRLPPDKRRTVQSFSSAGAELLRKLIDIILLAAPLCVAALTAATIGRYGANLAGPLGRFLLCVWSAQLVMACVYLLLLLALARVNPLAWLRQTAALYATTIATCSSLASLTVSMEIARKNLRIPERVYGFTLPVGAQFNKDGTSIMLSVLLLFTAQAMSPSMEFTLVQQVQIVLIGLLVSEGSGGIPGGGMVVALVFVKAFDLPIQAAMIVAGMYRLIDMGSTTVNCMGDLAWTTIAARLQGGSDEPGDSSEVA